MGLRFRSYAQSLATLFAVCDQKGVKRKSSLDLSQEKQAKIISTQTFLAI